jgi:hypothetical protein
MNSPKENVIRDKLAANLEVVESGLKLRAKELQIQNPQGAGGKIDIFAEDQWKNKVVIELKRSDKAARQAVHDLLKYTELLRDQHGPKHSPIRVMLLSTDWNELLVPFSSFIRDAKFPCEGYRITVDVEGNITGLKKVESLKEAHLLDFIPHHMIYCFSNVADRDFQIAILKQKLEQCGIYDFVIFLLNYAGQNKKVIAPFALYVCMGTVPLKHAQEIFSSLGVTDEVQEYLKNTDENEFDFFQCQIHEQVFATFSIHCDDFGIGYPEMAGHLANEWTLVSSWVWDGTTKPLDPKKFLTEIFGNPFEYLTHRHFGMLDQYYERLLQIHGFSMPILEIQEATGKEPAGFRLAVENAKLVRISYPVNHPPGDSLLDFLNANQEYMRKLVEFVEEYTTGLD